jgi:hypothetical protein
MAEFKTFKNVAVDDAGNPVSINFRENGYDLDPRSNPPAPFGLTVVEPGAIFHLDIVVASTLVNSEIGKANVEEVKADGSPLVSPEPVAAKPAAPAKVAEVKADA